MSQKAAKKRRRERRINIDNIMVQMLSYNGELVSKYVTE